MSAMDRAARRLLRRIPGGRRTARWLRDHLDPQSRSVARLAKRAPEGLFQPLATTKANRYPAIFDCVATALSDCVAPQILSFGCSTGEEVLAIGARFPHARITGLDINPYNIAVAKRRTKRLAPNAPRLICAASPLALADETFDAIFCLAVTRHAMLEAERPLDCSPWLRFEQFDDLMNGFDRLLQPGGILAIWNSHFRFADSAVAAQFTTVLHRAVNPARLPFYYGPDNRRIDDEPTYTAAVFQKR